MSIRQPPEKGQDQERIDHPMHLGDPVPEPDHPPLAPPFPARRGIDYSYMGPSHSQVHMGTASVVASTRVMPKYRPSNDLGCGLATNTSPLPTV
jgi:hypothetical protein